MLINSKIEHLLQEQEKNRILFTKKQEKIQKMEGELKTKNLHEDFSTPQLSVKNHSKARQSDFDKLKDKVKGLKNLLKTTEKIQHRELKKLEKQQRNLKQENSQLDEDLLTRKQVFFPFFL